MIKKCVAVLLILFLSVMTLFAKKKEEVREFDKTVCVIPSNTEIEHYLGMFLDKDKIKQGNVDFDIELLSTGDTRLMEYVSSTNSADIYVIPLVRSASGFNHLTLYVYDGSEARKIYERVDQKSSSFSVDIVLELYKYFTDRRYSLLQFENLVPGTTIYLDNKTPGSVDSAILVPEGEHKVRLSSLGYVSWEDTVNYAPDTLNKLEITLERPVYTSLVIESEPQANVFIDGVLMGQTPYEVKEYTVPLIFRLQAEGYTDRVVSVSAPSNKVNVKMKTIAMGDIDAFKKVQNKFYWSFTRTLLLFGGLAATKASGGFNSNTQKAINYGFYGAIGLSAIEMGYRLYKYFNSVRNISP